MSHISDLAMAFNDLDALEKAAASHHGGTLVRGATSYKWVGRWYGDSPVPRSLFGTNQQEYLRVCSLPYQEQKAYMENLLGKCAHKITFPGHTYEVGVVDVEGNLLLVWDWATPLQNIMGHVDSLGRNKADPLASFSATYILHSLRGQLDATRGEDAYSISHSISEDKKTIQWEITLE